MKPERSVALGIIADTRKDQKEPSEKEIAKRRDETLKRMLKIPPKPHSEMVVKKPLTKSAQRKPQGGSTEKPTK